MLYGCTENNQRSKPNYSGERATCPLCNGILIGKCGKIRIWHWQHKKDENCDTWKEGETEWHREWKLRFPEPWREVIIVKGDQKHRADLRTDAGTVIEFQNSPISLDEVEKRESFYENMVWVVHAKSFIQNIGLISLSEIKKAEFQKIQAAEYQELERQLSNSEWEIRSKFEIVNYQSEKIRSENTLRVEREKLLTLFNADKKAFIYELMDKDESDHLHLSNSGLLSRIKYDYKGQFFLIKNKEYAILTNKKKYGEFITEIEGYPTTVYHDITYRIVPPNRISPKSFRDFIAVDQADQTKAITFENESHFINIHNNFSKYLFLTDAKSRIERFKSLLSDAEKALRENDKLYGEIERAIYLELVPKVKSNVVQLDREGTDKKLRHERLALASELRKFGEMKESKLLEKTQELMRVYEEKQKHLDEEYRNHYRFIWRYERRCWREAGARIYFDTGEGYLLKLLYDDQVKRVEIRQFIEHYQQGNITNS